MDIPRMELRSEFLHRVRIEVEGFYEVGQTFRGNRTIVRVKGGWFEGPKLKGDIHSHVIYVSYRGIIDMSPEIWEKLGRGEDVDPSTYYLRGQPMFETAVVDNPYSWLNNVLAVSIGKQEKLGLTYDVYEIL